MNATTAGKVLPVKRKVIGIILVRIKLNFIPQYNNSQGRYFPINIFMTLILKSPAILLPLIAYFLMPKASHLN